jgi:DNA-binding LacI/PurR family transcriptional regulator
MAKKKIKPTLENIAARSGVSVATVSRVLNRSGVVSKDLEIRVKDAMQALGKEKSRAYTLAFIIPEVLNPANTQIMVGVYEEAEKRGIGVVTLNVSENAGSQQGNLKLLKQFLVDGLIIFHEQVEPDKLIAEYNLDEDLPIVSVGRAIQSPRVYCINTNRENGMYQATKYLLSLNHKRIAFLSGPPEWELSQARLKGIQRALAEAGLHLQPQLYRWVIPSIESGFQVTGNVLQLPPEERPTAILAFNDLMAIGASHAVRSVGLAVPDDVSIIGFDNIFITPHTNPPLTTVSQPKLQIGQLAVQKIVNVLNGYDAEKGGVTMLECPLVVRESTALCKIPL